MTTRVARSRPCRNTFGTEGQLLVNRHAEQLIYKKSAGFKTIDTVSAEIMKQSNGFKTIHIASAVYSSGIKANNKKSDGFRIKMAVSAAYSNDIKTTNNQSDRFKIEKAVSAVYSQESNGKALSVQ